MCLIAVIILALAAIGLHWLGSTFLGFFMHPILFVAEVGAVIVLTAFLIRLAPQAADWVGARLRKK